MNYYLSIQYNVVKGHLMTLKYINDIVKCSIYIIGFIFIEKFSTYDCLKKKKIQEFLLRLSGNEHD